MNQSYQGNQFHVQRAQKVNTAEIGLDLMALLEHLDQAEFEAYSWIFQVH